MHNRQLSREQRKRQEHRGQGRGQAESQEGGIKAAVLLEATQGLPIFSSICLEGEGEGAAPGREWSRDRRCRGQTKDMARKGQWIAVSAHVCPRLDHCDRVLVCAYGRLQGAHLRQCTAWVSTDLCVAGPSYPPSRSTTFSTIRPRTACVMSPCGGGCAQSVAETARLDLSR